MNKAKRFFPKGGAEKRKEFLGINIEYNLLNKDGDEGRPLHLAKKKKSKKKRKLSLKWHC